MRNQRSFRTKSRLKVVDNSVKVSQVIGKKDSNGQPFYPSFTNLTVVLVTEDKRTYETTKATADGLGNITFLKRGLADDGTDTEVAKFKRAWMPGTLMFVTIASEDIESKQDTLVAGCNITICGNTISATDTTYQSCDFDINDLGDSCSCKDYWNCAIQPNDNISCLCNDVGYTTCTGTVTACDLVCYAQCCDLGCAAFTNQYCDLSGQPTIGSANLILQKNGTDIDCFNANATVDKCINITVPTQACDICAMPDSVKYGASVDLTIDSSTYVVTSQLKDQDGCNLGSACTIDLPLESVVVDGCYNSCTKEIELTLQNCCQICFSVADLVSGLQSEITCSNKLSSDLVDDSGHTNLFVDCTEKCCISSALQPNDNVSCLCNDAGYLTTSTLPSLGSRVVKVEVATTNGTAAKTGTTTAGNYSPAAGDILLVHFKYGNSAAAVTLAVDSSAAKAIRIGGKLTTAATFTIPNQTDMYVYLMYDGQAYVAYPTDNTTYSASSFDIKNLSDSCSCRDHWNCAIQPNDNVSSLCNDAGYTTCTGTLVACDIANLAQCCDIPTDNCQLGNGCGYITSSALCGYALSCDIPTDNCELSNGCGYTTCTGTVTSSDLACYAQCCDMVCSLTGADNSHYPSAKAVADALSCAGAGDMLASTYDPCNCSTDAFNYNNMYNKPTIPTDNCQLANSCGYTTCTGTLSTCSDITTALGYTPYSAANPCGYTTCTGTLSSCSDVITALGFTPYSCANPAGYTTCTGTLTASDLTGYAKSCDLATVATSGKYCDLTGRVTDNCQLANSCGFTTCTGTLVASNIACVNGCCLTNGGNVCISGLPSQTGNCGKYLTTNGTTASWGTVTGGIDNDTTCTSTVVAHIRAGTEAEYNCIATKDSCTIYHIY